MRTRYWLRLALIVVGIGLLAYALGWFRWAEPAAPAATAAQAGSAPAGAAGFGPGHGSDVASAKATAAADTSPPDGLQVGADQHLRVNRALRDVFDYYLLGGLPGTRAEHMAQLLAHLKASLPPLAYADAERVAQSYVTYLAAHDALLERQTMPVVTADSKMAAPDADRMAAWLAQLSRLRQDTLGIEVAKVWFGDEEAESQRMLAALRSGAGTALGSAADDPRQKGIDQLRTLRQQGASQQAQHDMMAQQFGATAAQRFDQLGQEEQAWQDRYAQYRQAADQIRQQAGTAEADRERQIDTLRAQTFASDADRMRAAGLDRQ